MKNAKMFIFGLLIGMLLVSSTGAKIDKETEEWMQALSEVKTKAYYSALNRYMKLSPKELQARQLMELEQIAKATVGSYTNGRDVPKLPKR